MGLLSKVLKIAYAGDVNCARDMKFQSSAISALQEAAEAVIVDIMEDANCIAVHAKREKVMQEDVQAALGIWKRVSPWVKQSAGTAEKGEVGLV